MSQQPPQRPIETVRVGGIEIAIWQRETRGEDGPVAQHSITFKKRYHDKQTKEWRDSTTYFPSDLPKLRLAIDEAYRFVMLRAGAGDQPDAAADNGNEDS